MFVKVCGVNTEILTLRKTVCMRTLSCVIPAIHKFQYCKINIENGVTMFELKKPAGVYLPAPTVWFKLPFL